MGGEPSAPSVVAVVVTCSPGPWFDETLKSLAQQDYPHLSVMVAAVGDEGTISARVAAVIPGAKVVGLEEGRSFVDAANEALTMVDGTPHALLCHDDVALAPDAVRLLLEEAYRSNAGLTCPKCVLWQAPERLLSVGMGSDHLGVTHPLVEPGELDQGQHDAVREVFVAPSGAVLVRTDLWRALGGFDAAMGGPGEDLDLSWRAHLAGARVVVAPQAVVRHLEATRNGLRPAPRGELRREEHRFRDLWTCYSALGLLLVAPVAVLFALAEASWGFVHRRSRQEVLMPLKAFARSLRHPAQLWAARRRVQGMRRSSDLAVWKSQSRGSARLRAMLRLRLEKGHELAWAASRATSSPRPTKGPRLSWRWSAGAAAAVVALLLIGSRDVLTGPLPLVGQLPWPAGGTGAWWREWWSGTSSAGFGGTSLSPPGLLVMGVVGLLALGSANIAVHILVFGPLLCGPLGVYIGARAFGSDRGRLAATVLYAALPIPYNAVSQGHWSGLVAYAAAPWLISGLCSLGGQEPFTFRHWDAAWPRFLALGLGLALAASLAPALLLLVPIIGCSLFAGSLLAGRSNGGGRFFGASLIVTAVAFVALMPWALSLLGSWAALVGSPGSAPSGPLSLSHVLRLETGSFGGGPLGWGLVFAAGAVLLIGRSWRLAWASRMAGVTAVCMALAWTGSRGWLRLPGAEVLLAPAGAALVFAVALGAASVELDVPGYRFGWRQFAPPLGALAALAAVVPLIGWAGNGLWGLPSSGAEEAFAFPAPSPAGDYRVLWVGQPASLPMAAQGRVDGLSFAASLDGLPSADQLWAPGASAQSAIVGRDIALAEQDATTALGHLLAPLSVRYIVVPTSGAATAQLGQLGDALGRQIDLVPVGLDPSYEVFQDTAWLPVFSVLPDKAEASGLAAQGQGNDAWAAAGQLQKLSVTPSAVLAVGAAGGTATIGARSRGPVLYGTVTAGAWRAVADGRGLVAHPAGRVGVFWVLPSGVSSLAVAPAPPAGQRLADLAMLFIWGVALWAVRSRLRKRLGDQLVMVNLEFGSPSSQVMEIDWPSLLEGRNVG